MKLFLQNGTTDYTYAILTKAVLTTAFPKNKPLGMTIASDAPSTSVRFNSDTPGKSVMSINGTKSKSGLTISLSSPVTE